MAFKKVGNGKFTYLKYAECEAGQILATGVYLGTRQGTFGIQHQIRDDKGDVTVLNSSGHLNFLLENNVSKGDYIQVTYAGTETLKKGKFKGKDSHQFEVGIDEERGNDSSAKPIDSGSSGSGEDEEETDAEEDEDEEAEEEEAEAAKPEVKAPAAKAAAQKPAEKAAPAASGEKKKLSSEELLAKYRTNKKGA